MYDLLSGSRILDTGDQNLEEESCIRLEEPVVHALAILGGWLGELVVVSCLEDGRRGQNNSSEAVLVHSHHGLFQSWWEFPTSNRPGKLVEFRVGLGGEVFDASRLVGRRKGLASNRNFGGNLGALFNHWKSQGNNLAREHQGNVAEEVEKKETHT